MTEHRRSGHSWQPIEDLPVDLRVRRFPELDALITMFDQRRGELEGVSALHQ